MFYQLPPVGNSIRLSSANTSQPLFGSTFQPHFFNSGTAALAAAITAAIRFKGVDNPEVLIPAYGCPDLISAAVFAGAKPVLVDIEINRPWVNLEQLSTKLNTQTVAIVAVNLFGISERIEQLRPLAEQAGVLLIEDSAQAFPKENEDNIWQGDLVVISFGRGKPVSLLGGGAVLHRRETQHYSDLAQLLPECPPQTSSTLHQRMTFRLKTTLYNLMIHPRLYWLPQSMPFLHLGETRFHPLTSLNGINPIKLSILAANIRAYQNSSLATQNQLHTILSSFDANHPGITDLPRACNMAKTRRLLRYPLLLKAEIRDPLHMRLQKLGLGSSRMYLKTLPEISGLKNLLSGQGPFPAATAFANNLLTLPTHSHVKQENIDKIHQVLTETIST